MISTVQLGIAATASHYGRVWLAVARFIVRLDLRQTVLADYLVGHRGRVHLLQPVGGVLWSAAGESGGGG